MNNSLIADKLELLADLLEFQGASPFRTRAYRNGARAIRELGERVEAIVRDNPKRLLEIDGVGESVAAKCATLVETGRLPQLEELQAEVPESVLALLRIPGMGPKKAAMLFKELKITTLAELQAACEAHTVRDLKGFGAKTEEKILKGIAQAAATGERLRWDEADRLAQSLREHLHDCPGLARLELAGSYRRGRDTVGDLDILAVADDPVATMDRLADFPGIAEVLARGDTKMSVRVGKGFQVDLRVVPARSFGAAWQYFTGSKDHNVALRGLAKDRGLKINEWGVFRVEEDKSETYIGGATEEEVYGALELPVFPPEMREARQEFSWAKGGELPKLIELADIRGDLHMHTTETDGRGTLEEMAQAAIDRGLEYIAITDHSPRVSMARGLTPDRLRAQWAEIEKLNAHLAGKLTILKGVECDILEKGGMDLPADVLAEADWVLASIHYGQSQPREQITARLLEAIEHPHVTAVAHPTGRLINQREAYETDLDAIFAAAKKHKKILELNASPQRLDLNDIYCAAAKSHGIPIVIDTDAHSVDGLSDMRYGVLQARRAGLTKNDVANARPLAELLRLIGKA
jgi:DNA polymerase (family 10)